MYNVFHLPLLSACIRWYSLSHIHYGNGTFKMFLKSVGSQLTLIQDSDFILDIKWAPKIMESIFTFRLMLIFFIFILVSLISFVHEIFICIYKKKKIYIMFIYFTFLLCMIVYLFALLFAIRRFHIFIFI